MSGISEQDCAFKGEKKVYMLLGFEDDLVITCTGTVLINGFT